MASWWHCTPQDRSRRPALAVLSQARGRLMREASGDVSGSMAALMTGADEVEKLVSEIPEVRVANWNGPSQTVIAGPTNAVESAVELAASRGIQGRMLPVSRAFHTPLVAAAREPLRRLAESLLDVCSRSPGLLQSRWPAAPVRPRRDRQAARRPSRAAGSVCRHDRGNVSGWSARLRGGWSGVRPHDAGRLQPCRSAASRDLVRRRRLIRPASLAAGDRPARDCGGAASSRTADPRPGRRVLDLHRLPQVEGAENWTPSTWLVNGSRARPVAEPERRRLGMGTALPAPKVEPSRSDAPLRAEPARSETPKSVEPPHVEAPRQASAPRPIVSSGSNLDAAGSGDQSNGTHKPVLELILPNETASWIRTRT